MQTFFKLKIPDIPFRISTSKSLYDLEIFDAISNEFITHYDTTRHMTLLNFPLFLSTFPFIIIFYDNVPSLLCISSLIMYQKVSREKQHYFSHISRNYVKIFV